MSKELIDKLSNLKLARNSLKRLLDTKSFSPKTKTKVFSELEKVNQEIELVKFKLKLEKELNSEKFREKI